MLHSPARRVTPSPQSLPDWPAYRAKPCHIHQHAEWRPPQSLPNWPAYRAKPCHIHQHAEWRPLPNLSLTGRRTAPSRATFTSTPSDALSPISPWLAGVPRQAVPHSPARRVTPSPQSLPDWPAYRAKPCHIHQHAEWRPPQSLPDWPAYRAKPCHIHQHAEWRPLPNLSLTGRRTAPSRATFTSTPSDALPNLSLTGRRTAPSRATFTSTPSDALSPISPWLAGVPRQAVPHSPARRVTPSPISPWLAGVPRQAVPHSPARRVTPSPISPWLAGVPRQAVPHSPARRVTPSPISPWLAGVPRQTVLHSPARRVTPSPQSLPDWPAYRAKPCHIHQHAEWRPPQSLPDWPAYRAKPCHIHQHAEWRPLPNLSLTGRRTAPNRATFASTPSDALSPISPWLAGVPRQAVLHSPARRVTPSPQSLPDWPAHRAKPCHIHQHAEWRPLPNLSLTGRRTAPNRATFASTPSDALSPISPWLAGVPRQAVPHSPARRVTPSPQSLPDWPAYRAKPCYIRQHAEWRPLPNLSLTGRRTAPSRATFTSTPSDALSPISPWLAGVPRQAVPHSPARRVTPSPQSLPDWPAYRAKPCHIHQHAEWRPLPNLSLTGRRTAPSRATFTSTPSDALSPISPWLAGVPRQAVPHSPARRVTPSPISPWLAGVPRQAMPHSPARRVTPSPISPWLAGVPRQAMPHSPARRVTPSPQSLPDWPAYRAKPCHIHQHAEWRPPQSLPDWPAYRAKPCHIHQHAEWRPP